MKPDLKSLAFVIVVAAISILFLKQLENYTVKFAEKRYQKTSMKGIK